MTRRTSGRPSPDPERPAAFDPRASSAHTLWRSDTGIPIPVSATSMLTLLSDWLARTSMLSPSLEYFTALNTTFWMAEYSRSASPTTRGSGHGAVGNTRVKLRESPTLERAASTASRAASSKSTNSRSRGADDRSASLRRSVTSTPIRRACAATSADASSSPGAVAARIAVRGFFNSWSRRARNCLCSRSRRASASAIPARRACERAEETSTTPTATADTRTPTIARTVCRGTDAHTSRPEPINHHTRAQGMAMAAGARHHRIRFLIVRPFR